MTAQGQARPRSQNEDEIVPVLQWLQDDIALLVTGDHLTDGSSAVPGGRTLRLAEGDPLIGAHEPVASRSRVARAPGTSSIRPSSRDWKGSRHASLGEVLDQLHRAPARGSRGVATRR